MHFLVQGASLIAKKNKKFKLHLIKYVHPYNLAVEPNTCSVALFKTKSLIPEAWLVWHDIKLSSSPRPASVTLHI